MFIHWNHTKAIPRIHRVMEPKEKKRKENTITHHVHTSKVEQGLTSRGKQNEGVRCITKV